mgnify:CR=1 FL=1
MEWSMGQAARWSDLLSILQDSEHLTIRETALRLDVSEATVRRDFDELTRQGLLTRVRGGVVRNELAADLPLRFKTSRHAEEKQRIATVAARMVDAGSTVGLNGGTTSAALARTLAARADLEIFKVDPALTIVTSALNIAYDLATRPNIRTVIVGGVLRQRSYELIGPLATKILDEITMDCCFLSVDAINASDGATTHHEGEASINSLLARRAGKIIVIADGSKVGKRAFARIAHISSIDTLVTDESAPPDSVDEIASAGCHVVRA